MWSVFKRIGLKIVREYNMQIIDFFIDYITYLSTQQILAFIQWASFSRGGFQICSYSCLKYINSNTSWRCCWFFDILVSFCMQMQGTKQIWPNLLSFWHSQLASAAKQARFCWILLDLIKLAALASWLSQKDRQFSHFCLVPHFCL